MIQRSAEDMLQIVNDLLDAAKIKAGKFEVIKSDADVKKIILAIIEEYKPLVSEKGMKLETRLPEEEVHGEVDAIRIHQVIAYQNIERMFTARLSSPGTL